MRTPYLVTLAATLLAAPLAYADLAAPPASTPEPQCETTAADLQGHGYLSTGAFFVIPVDGSAATCGSGGDGHAEYGLGGTVLLASTPLTAECRGAAGDHSWYPTVTVVDDALGTNVTFEVWAYVHVVFPDEPCAVPDASLSITCTHTCTVPFPPSADGAYFVNVPVGTTGRVTAS